MPRLLTIDEAAAELGVRPGSLRGAAERFGLLVKMGRSVRIDPNDISELIQIMPTTAKGARLYRRRDTGFYLIRDTGRGERSTGTRDRREA